ncbi:MAG: PHB depolymerase family esterase [Burkholderiaceae bacterium]
MNSINAAGFWVVACIAVAACESLAQPARAEIASEEVTIIQGGRQRSALIRVPSSYVPSKPAPLVLVFHGGGGNAANAERTTSMRAQAEKHGLIVAYPNGTGVLKQTLLTWNTWNCCGYAMQNDVDDVGFVRELIATLKRRYSIDTRRIFATGLSNGAMLSYRLACEMSDQIAAIAPVAGALNTDSCAPREPVSVAIFHGTSDQHVRYDGGRNTKQFPGAKPRDDKSVNDAFSTWTKIDKCQPSAPTQYAPSVRKTECSNGEHGSEVVLYSIEGQGHAWPGGTPGLRNGNVDPPSQQISATEVMIDFFLRHPRQ